MIIQLHNPQTWPDEINEFINQHKSLIRSYVESSNEPEECFNPDNPDLEINSAEFEAISKELRILLNLHYIEMEHCTKLLPHEIEDIKHNGLRILTAELVEERINAAFEHNYLSAQEKAFLLEDYQRKLENGVFQTRQNQLWFVTPKHLSSERCFVGRLFKSWGGESVYNEHDHKQTPIAHTLKAIGIPCIVKANVLIADLDFGLGKIENAVIHSSGIVSDLGYCSEFDGTHGDAEGYVENDISANYIEEIIEFNNPKFGELYNRESFEELMVDLSIKQ